MGGATADDPKFIKQDVGLDGGRTMLVRTMEPGDDGEVVEEVVIVKTDIDAPKATPFEKVPGETQVLDVNPNTTERRPKSLKSLMVETTDMHECQARSMRLTLPPAPGLC